MSRYDEDKKKKKKKQEGILEAQIMAIMQKSLEAAMRQVIDDLFKGFH